MVRIGRSRQPRFPAIASSYTRTLLSKHLLDNLKIIISRAKLGLTLRGFEQQLRV